MSIRTATAAQMRSGKEFEALLNQGGRVYVPGPVEFLDNHMPDIRCDGLEVVGEIGRTLIYRGDNWPTDPATGRLCEVIRTEGFNQRWSGLTFYPERKSVEVPADKQAKRPGTGLGLCSAFRGQRNGTVGNPVIEFCDAGWLTQGFQVGEPMRDAAGRWLTGTAGYGGASGSEAHFYRCGVYHCDGWGTISGSNSLNCRLESVTGGDLDWGVDVESGGMLLADGRCSFTRVARTLPTADPEVWESPAIFALRTAGRYTLRGLRPEGCGPVVQAYQQEAITSVVLDDIETSGDWPDGVRPHLYAAVLRGNGTLAVTNCSFRDRAVARYMNSARTPDGKGFAFAGGRVIADDLTDWGGGPDGRRPAVTADGGPMARCVVRGSPLSPDGSKPAPVVTDGPPVADD